MRTWTLAAAVALTLTTAACGGDDPETEAGAAAESAAAAPSEAAEAAESTAAVPSAIAESPAGGDTEVLQGMVGTQEDPDAFEITLTNSSGQPVTELPAGDYSIVVQDLSDIHNFHLMGAGVEESTTVPETGETTWDVTFTEGDYEAICDPHPNMRLDFTVT